MCVSENKLVKPVEEKLTQIEIDTISQLTLINSPYWNKKNAEVGH